jgi:hypothetical protein
MSQKRFVVLILALACSLFSVGGLAAQEVKASGANMFVPEIVETFTLSDGTKVNRTKSNGFIVADDPSNPLRQASMTCTGTMVESKDGKPIRSAGTCDTVDAQGDVAFYWWRYDEKNGGKWGFLGGTGKWTAVEGGGTWEPTPGFKDGRQSNNWKGTWKAK